MSSGRSKKTWCFYFMGRVAPASLCLAGSLQNMDW